MGQKRHFGGNASMKRRSTFWILNAILAVLLLAGCQSSDSGPSSSPTPVPSPQRAAAQATRYVEGHTETVIDPQGHTQPSTDDGDHCFRREKKDAPQRNLVLIVHAPEISDTNTSTVLFDSFHGTQRQVSDIKPDPVNGIATVTIKDDSLNRQNRQHLGPGPYDAVTTIDTTAPALKDKSAASKRIVLPFFYVTYPNDPSECPVISPSQASR
jgi:hypothetical protein